MLLGCMAFVVSHWCVYEFGKAKGLMDAFRPDAPYRQEGMRLRDGETFLGVVDAKHGPYFCIGDAGEHRNYN
jgi:hypothetical protein